MFAATGATTCIGVHECAGDGSGTPGLYSFWLGGIPKGRHLCGSIEISRNWGQRVRPVKPAAPFDRDFARLTAHARGVRARVTRGVTRGVARPTLEAMTHRPLPESKAQETLLARAVRGVDLARAIGVSEKSASRWLRGEKVPDDEHAAAIEKAFGVPRGDWRLASKAMRAQLARHRV